MSSSFLKQKASTISPFARAWIFVMELHFLLHLKICLYKVGSISRVTGFAGESFPKGVDRDLAILAHFAQFRLLRFEFIF